MFFHHSTAHAEAKVDVAYEISVLEVGGCNVYENHKLVRALSRYKKTSFTGTL